MKKTESRYKDLEDRVIEFAVCCINIAAGIKNDNAGNHLKNQLVRAGSSVALNYAEARYAESRKDFVHKIKIVLKELHETHVCLRMIARIKLYHGKENIDAALGECDELISIFVKSANTAQKNLVRKPEIERQK